MDVAALVQQQGWNERTLNTLLTAFIDVQGLGGQLRAFLDRAAAGENGEAWDESDGIPADHNSGDCDPPCRMCRTIAAADVIPIKRVLNGGELKFDTYAEMMKSAGTALDQAKSYDIVGNVVFEGADGKMYGLFVEAIVRQVERTYALEQAHSDQLTEAERAEVGL